MTIEFLILLPFILFITFGGTDYFVTQVQQDQIEHIKSYYLDRMKIEGTLTDNDRTSLYNELVKHGFNTIDISAMDAYGTSLDSSTILVRNIDDPDQSKMIFEIQASPKFKPFMFGKLLGISPDGNFYFKVGGETLSEKPKNS